VPVVRRDSSRWYYEITFRQLDSPQHFGLGCGEFVHTVTLIPRVHEPPITLGVAVDLDAGRIYVNDNGRWKPGAPGGDAGVPLTTGPLYSCGVASSKNLRELVERRALEANFGAGGSFLLPVPEGYIGFLGDPPPR
jgi:hypothetical protein